MGPEPAPRPCTAPPPAPGTVRSLRLLLVLTAVDVSQFTAAQTTQVRDHVDSLPDAQRDRITIVGGG